MTHGKTANDDCVAYLPAFTPRHRIARLIILSALSVFQPFPAAANNDSSPATIADWTFNQNGNRLGWSVPEQMTGAVIGGTLWLTPSPKAKTVTDLTSLNYQIYGDYDVLTRRAAGEKPKTDGPSDTGALSIAEPSHVSIISPPNLDFKVRPEPQKQACVQVRLINSSPATDLYLRWRSSDMKQGSWKTQRAALVPSSQGWQVVQYHLEGDPTRKVDQIALGIWETVIRGDLWIRSIRVEQCAPAPAKAKEDIIEYSGAPRISVPGLSPDSLVDAFRLLNDLVVTDVPNQGFPFPYMKLAGDNKYGDRWDHSEAPTNAQAASWVNQPFADGVMLGFHKVQAENPDGRISGYSWEPVRGQAGDVNMPPIYYFEAAHAIALRTPDAAVRAEIFESMRKFADWYLSPVKRDSKTGLVTGTWEEAVLFPVSKDDSTGFSYVQSRAPISLNASIAVATSLTGDLAEQIGKMPEADYYRGASKEIARSINTYLWDEKDGYYYDYNLSTRTHFKFKTAATFYALRNGIATPDRRRQIIRHLINPKEFNWGKSILPNIALTESLSPDGSKKPTLWQFVNLPIIQGLEDAGYSDLAADLNWKALQMFGSNYSEYYSLAGEGLGGQKYGATAAGYISCVIEHLFGVKFDSVQNRLSVAPHVPKALYGQTLELTNLRLPGHGDTRLSISVRQTNAKSARVTVSVAGALPKGNVQIKLPNMAKTLEIPFQRSIVGVYP